MGQYHHVVNLDKKQSINPHKLASGLKLWEQLAAPHVGQALVILLASGSNGQGGGDLQPAPIVGAWRGDRIAFVGDYDDRSIYTLADGSTMTGAEMYGADDWIDVSAEVCAVIETEMNGKFVGDGWRDFVANEE